jgi:hypothetical protein
MIDIERELAWLLAQQYRGRARGLVTVREQASEGAKSDANTQAQAQTTVHKKRPRSCTSDHAFCAFSPDT